MIQLKQKDLGMFDFSGLTVAVGGFGGHGIPEVLVDSILMHGCNYHLVTNDMGDEGGALTRLVMSGKCRKITCSFVGQNNKIQPMLACGVFDIIPQGRFAFSLMAGTYKIDYFVDDGEKVSPVIIDIALCKGSFSDKTGNIAFDGTDMNFNPAMAKAAKKTIFQVDKIKNKLSNVVLPGAFVDYVVEC